MKLEKRTGSLLFSVQHEAQDKLRLNSNRNQQSALRFVVAHYSKFILNRKACLMLAVTRGDLGDVRARPPGQSHRIQVQLFCHGT